MKNWRYFFVPILHGQQLHSFFCKELLQLWEQPAQLGNDHPVEHVAVPGIRYELPSVAINILDIKYSKLCGAQTTSAG